MQRDDVVHLVVDRDQDREVRARLRSIGLVGVESHDRVVSRWHGRFSRPCTGGGNRRLMTSDSFRFSSEPSNARSSTSIATWPS